MFFQSLESYWRPSFAEGIAGGSVSFFSCIVGLLALYVAWYVWTFRLALLWRPSEPEVLPYLIPFVGHARWFFNDRDALFAHARSYFRNEPCTLIIAGTKLYMVSLPQHFSEIYRNTATLSFDLFVRDFHESFGMSPTGVDKMWEVPMAHEKHLDQPGRKHLVQRSADFHRLQLFPGPHLEDLNARFLERIEYGTQWNTVPKSCIMSSTAEEMVVSLYKWCGHVLVDASTRAFYGDALVDTEPTIIHDFLEFDEHSWMLLYKYPSLLAKAMTRPRERVLQSFDRYVMLPRSKKEDTAYFTQALEAEQVQAGMSTRDRAVGFQIFHFAMNANAYKMCFWLVAHTIYKPDLLTSIRNEILPAIQEGKIDINYLVDEKNCPVLNAAFNETLRYTSAATSGRVVLSPTQIGAKTLYPGARVLMPYRPSHLENAIFGSTSNEFDPERFVRAPELAKNPAYRPFGGGSQYCSGRFIARREVIGFLAFVLDRFDVRLKNAQGYGSVDQAAQIFPRLDVNKPNLGIISPTPGDDILVSITPRKRDAL